MLDWSNPIFWAIVFVGGILCVLLVKKLTNKVVDGSVPESVTPSSVQEDPPLEDSHEEEEIWDDPYPTRILVCFEDGRLQELNCSRCTDETASDNGHVEFIWQEGPGSITSTPPTGDSEVLSFKDGYTMPFDEVAWILLVSPTEEVTTLEEGDLAEKKEFQVSGEKVIIQYDECDELSYDTDSGAVTFESDANGDVLIQVGENTYGFNTNVAYVFAVWFVQEEVTL